MHTQPRRIHLRNVRALVKVLPFHHQIDVLDAPRVDLDGDLVVALRLRVENLHLVGLQRKRKVLVLGDLLRMRRHRFKRG